MANRVIKQKIIKRARMRRAWAKKFAMRASGPTASPGYLNDKGDFVGIGFGDRTKAGQRIHNFDTMSKWLLETFKPNSNEAIYATTRGLHTDVWPGGREVVLTRINQSRKNAGSLQGESRYVYQKMNTDSPNHELRLYMAGDSNYFASEMITKTERIYKMSIEYTIRSHAVDAYKNNRITWDKIERKSLQTS